ncbi:MAG: hypothetical protein JW927_01845 [Deltaproteobacteria bacterium]|nr:hypothetical protein [Deltaproteobacteria bacterium]
MLFKFVNCLVKSLFLLILLTGCGLTGNTYLVVPSTQDVNPNRVHNLKLNGKINLVNIQSIKTNTQLGVLSHNFYEGNFNEWTNKTIQLLKRELEKRGGEVSESGLKTLSLSVVAAQLETRSAGSGTRCTLTLHVETGDGYKKDIFVVNNAGIGVDRPAGGAITLAITELLNDEKILKYFR